LGERRIRQDVRDLKKEQQKEVYQALSGEEVSVFSAGKKGGVRCIVRVITTTK